MISPIVVSVLLKDITRDLYAVAETFFVEYVTNVILNIPHADLELCGYFFVRQAARYGKRDPALSISQVFVLKTGGRFRVC